MERLADQSMARFDKTREVLQRGLTLNPSSAALCQVVLSHHFQFCGFQLCVQGGNSDAPAEACACWACPAWRASFWPCCLDTRAGHPCVACGTWQDCAWQQQNALCSKRKH